MTDLFIEERHLEEIRNIINRLYPNAVVWAYGSRVDGTAHENSDLDLAVVDFGQPNGSTTALQVASRESNVPFPVDWLDYKALPDKFQEEIAKKYVVVYEEESLN